MQNFSKNVYTFQIRPFRWLQKRKTNSCNKHRNIHHVTENVLLLQKWSTYKRTPFYNSEAIQRIIIINDTPNAFDVEVPFWCIYNSHIYSNTQYFYNDGGVVGRSNRKYYTCGMWDEKTTIMIIRKHFRKASFLIQIQCVFESLFFFVENCTY